MKTLTRTAIFATALILSAGLSSAQTDSSFEVRATVVDSCIVATEDLDFGNYDPNGIVPSVATANITATCTLLTPYQIAIDKGTVGPAANDRKMDDDATSSETLSYTLGCVGLTTQNCVTNWGETAGVDTYAFVGTGLAIPVVVTGTLPAGQQVTPGAYRDNPVTATVIF